MDTLKLYGVPGSGKTTRGLDWLEDRLNDGCDPWRTAFVSFTNAAVDEAKARITTRFGLEATDLPYCRTIHSLCKRALRITEQDWRAEDHLASFSESYGFDMQANKRNLDDEDDLEVLASKSGRDAPLLRVWDFARHRLKNNAREGWEAFADYSPYDVARLDRDRFDAFVTEYEGWKQALGYRDFTDLLVEYLRDGEPAPVELAVVDEAQDNSELLAAASDKLFSLADYRATCGDDDQCQPPGTMVLTPDGYVPIETLTNSSRVISYSKDDAFVCGWIKNGYSVEVAKNLYSGDMVTITCDGKKTRVTPNHKWIFKWNDRAKAPETTVVYLMRQGNRFRVGWCQLVRSDGVFHLWVRATQEDADAVWILSVHDNKCDASLWESIISIKYGLPTVPFNQTNSHVYYTKENLDFVFDQIGDLEPAANRCLKDFGRLIEYPLVTKAMARTRRGGVSIITTETCNLVPGIMNIPSHQKRQKVKWCPINSAERSHYYGYVYSLNVERYHLYLADGLVTHNSINVFMGADPSILNSREAHEVIKLEHSWRCPGKIARLAQSIIQLNSNRESKTIQPREGDEGVAETIYDLDEVDLLNGEEWGILARNWKLFDTITEQLEQAGVPYRYVGKRYSPWAEWGPLRAVKAVQRLRRTGAVTLGEMQVIASKGRTATEAKPEGAWAWGAKKTLKERADESPHEGVRFADLADLGMTEWGVRRLLTDELSILTTGVSPRDLTAYDVALRKGTMDARQVTLSSIHGWKGREFQNVIGLMGCGRNVARSMLTAEGREEEHRVAYVAVTRARERFYALRMKQASNCLPWEIFAC